jgi:UDP-glucose 4-epimerase
MATYLITGSSGYIGTRMTRLLLEREPDARIIGVDVRRPRIDSDRLEFHQLDVRDPRLVELARGRGIKSLCHFAFVLDPFYDEKEMTDIDLGGTRNVLEAVRTAGIPHLLATSSTTAYGAREDNPVPLDEDDPTRAEPRFVYAHDKRKMDEMLRDFAARYADTRVCILRPCIVLGPNVQNYIAATMLGLPVTALLDGRDPPMQFIHEDDLVELLWACLSREASGVFNAAADGALRLSEAGRLQGKRIVKMPFRPMYGLLWASWRLRLTDFALPPGVLDFFRNPWVASNDKAKRELAWTPRYTTRDCFDILLSRKSEVLDNFRAYIKQRGKR